MFDEVVVRVERKFSSRAEIELNGVCDPVEQYFREQVKALDFQMQGSCKAWAFVEETTLFRCDGVIAGLKQRLKVFRVLNEVITRLFIPSQNDQQKLVLPGQFGKCHSEAIAVLGREAVALRPNEFNECVQHCLSCHISW